MGIYSWAECQRRGLPERARLALALLETLLVHAHASFAALAFIASSPSIASALEFYLVFIEVRPEYFMILLSRKFERVSIVCTHTCNAADAQERCAEERERATTRERAGPRALLSVHSRRRLAAAAHLRFWFRAHFGYSFAFATSSRAANRSSPPPLLTSLFVCLHTSFRHLSDDYWGTLSKYSPTNIRAHT